MHSTESFSEANEIEQILFLRIGDGQFAAGKEEEGIETAQSICVQHRQVFGRHHLKLAVRSGDVPENFGGDRQTVVTITRGISDVQDALGLGSECRSQKETEQQQGRQPSHD
jgi:hypothetical protein